MHDLEVEMRHTVQSKYIKGCVPLKGDVRPTLELHITHEHSGPMQNQVL